MLAYAEAGWYIAPVDASKNPGSLLGPGWQHQTSRDEAVIRGWFGKFRKRVKGIALHMGPSGAVAFDADHTDRLTGVLACELNGRYEGPVQSTRDNDDTRRHFLFELPGGFMCGSSTAGFEGQGWGEIRGGNAVIIVEPTPHEKEHGHYQWLRTGPVCMVPDDVLVRLRPPGNSGTVSDEGVDDFCADYARGDRTDILDRVLGQYREAVDKGGSRHCNAFIAICKIARDAVDGRYPAEHGFDRLGEMFEEHTSDRYRSGEWEEMLRDGVGRVLVAAAEREKESADDPWAKAVPDEPAQPTGLEVFAPDVSPAVREAAERMLEYKAAQRLVSRYEASQRTNATMTVSQALDAVLSGQATVTPTVARLAGGGRSGLFYPGLVNGVYGDASVGKSVIQAEVEARTLADGGIVVHWEFDNNPVTVIVARLLHAGATREHIEGRFHVLYSTLDRDALTDDVQRAVRLVTLDALNPAVTSLGGDPYHPGGIDNAVREFFAPFTLHGACGLFVDHVGHESKDRQAGSIRKAQAVQGALYECQFEAPLKPGLIGRTRLILRKDNQGALGDQVGKTVATAVMTSEAEKGAPAGPVRTVFEAPDPFVSEEKEDEKWTEAERIEWAVRKMDEAGVPTGLSQRATHAWMNGEGVKIPLRRGLKNDAIDARNHRAEKEAAVPIPEEGPTGPPPLRVSGAIPSDTR
ncbi:bifunctional DNA primase/polymerase [Streptomyces sp. Root1310]|uniref:bifunctional DNA primase/polymerase n=1 Tax=Streptomyces sp. Root1310 TaxID=1736452 RepID=UPI0007108979|nr:bifunctional DNA primase/polymerase [Streptomyces sp. Root1310]KQX63430.1 hypothetical protein ASD48_26080 [Streptomyces sp. Root1310]